jgi:hypothetical protein
MDAVRDRGVDTEAGRDAVGTTKSTGMGGNEPLRSRLGWDPHPLAFEARGLGPRSKHMSFHEVTSICGFHVDKWKL